MTTAATYSRTVTVDLPDHASVTITFRILSTVAIAAGAAEIFPGKAYTLALDANGVGSTALPCPDNTGDAAWLWRVELPDNKMPQFTLAYDALSISLATLLVTAVATESADEIAALISGKQDKDTDAVADNLAKFASGQTVDSGIAAADVGVALGTGGTIAQVWTNDGDSTASWQDAAVYNAVVHGATGDGTTDDTAAILAAIAAAKAAGGGVVFLPKGTYLISKSLVLSSNVELRGAGAQSKITKAATVKSLLTANANIGDFAVTVTDSTGFAVGKAIHLYDTSSFEWLSTQAVITDITGNVITFDDAIDGNLQTARSAAATTSFSLIRNEVASTDVVVRDLTLDQNANASDPANDFTLSIIHWVETYRSLVENCTLINACGDAYSDQAQDGTGITPAANLIKTTKNTIKGCKIRTVGRHGIHLGTCIRGGYILDNDIIDCPNGFGYFYCAFTTETIAANNRMENCFSGFAGIDERDYDNIIIGNTTKNMTTGFAVDAVGTSGGRLTIVGNLFLCDATAGTDVKNARVLLNVPDSIFQGNVINMAAKTGEGLRIGANAARCIISDNKIIGTSGAGGTTGCQIDAVSDVRFSNNSIGSFSKCVSVRGATRLIAEGNQLSPVSTCWNFEVATSTDCIIRGERTIFATPVTEGVAATRLIYEGIGTNGASDPASAGDWNAASGRRFDGTLVRWNSGGGEKISIFYNGVGWTALN